METTRTSSNCTLLELKHRNGADEYGNTHVLIVPYWN